jgi:hypothetical protein
MVIDHILACANRIPTFKYLVENVSVQTPQ